MESTDPVRHPERVVRLLAEIVSIPSINVDRAKSDACNPEAAMVDFLEERLSGMGCEIERRPVRAGRENLFARLPGIDRTKTLALEAHVDTIGVEGMTVEPHAPRIVDGRMTGRGTCDAKGAVAAYVEALHRVAESDRPPPWDVLFIGAMGEETGCEGAKFLAKAGFQVDAAVVGEATFCRPMIAHKGAIWWELSTEGVTAHGSSPHLGVSAVYRMGHVLRALETDIPKRLAEKRDPVLGHATISCGTISGGMKVNVVPARATVSLDSRVLPDTDPQEHVEQVVDWIRESAGEQTGPLSIDSVDANLGFRLDPGQPFVQVCLAACREELPGDVEPTGGAFFSDAGPLSGTGTPCVVLGPGDIAKAHSPDEYLDLEELLRGAKIVEKIIRGVG